MRIGTIVVVLAAICVCGRYAMKRHLGTGGKLHYPTEAHGYDLSHHNKNIDWQQLEHAQFVYLKATESIHFVDPCYKAYLAKARAHGLKAGAYHFMRPNTSGKRQFEHFKSIVGSDVDLIPVLDVEVNGITDANIRQFVEACEAYYGVKPMIYSSVSMKRRHRNATSDCKWWMARSVATSRHDYDIWQYAEGKRVGGMRLDHNYINPRHTLDDFLL